MVIATSGPHVVAQPATFESWLYMFFLAAWSADKLNGSMSAVEIAGRPARSI